MLARTLLLIGIAAISLEPLAAATLTLTPADRTAAFKAAGAKQRGGKWVICADDPQASGANVSEVRDLNGDGRPEVVIEEGGSFCYGAAETGFAIVSKQPEGRWRLIVSESGMPEFLKTKGVGGWPDISIGGPGFCFPVERWNGREYVFNRKQYDGKPCR